MLMIYCECAYISIQMENKANKAPVSEPQFWPPKLINPTSADHSLPVIWSKILLRNRARSAQSSTKYGLLLNTGLIILCRLHSWLHTDSDKKQQKMVKIILVFTTYVCN